jgi:nicotinate phosphoribosyltransferase
MTAPSRLYRPSLALLTDFYELTMAAAAWKSGLAAREAVFSVTFRANPFGGGFAVAAGLEHAVDLVEHLRFEPDDLAFLAEQTGADGAPLFEPGFLELLGRLAYEVDVDAVPEGTVVFPQEPLVRVAGPVIPAMLLESALLNVVNFQTLVATKAARICLAARGAPVLEFGLRRAQGIDGAIAATRAAFVGGVGATSNTLAGRLLGIPVRGTHAHAWVMLVGDEREAFDAYARALPANCVFLVDTYSTLDGVRNAIEAGRALRAAGRELLGIRLDSGDLAWLSIEARRLLDEAGFPNAAIYGSNDLDEHVIASLEEQGAKIGVWGVGTRLVSGQPDAALGGVYKLGAVREGPGGAWSPRLKLSEQVAKTSVPGVLQIRRYTGADGFLADVVYDEGLGIAEPAVMVDPLDPTRRRELPAGTPGEDLLVPIFRRGRRVWEPPPLPELQARTRAQLARLHPGVKRFLNPHTYPVGLEKRLHELRTALVLAARRAPE